MCFSPSRSHPHSPGGFPLLSLLVLHLAAASPASSTSTCFESRLPELAGRPAATVMLRLGIEGEDLVVTAHWSIEPSHPDTAFVLSTPTEEIGSWLADSAPGAETVQILPGALALVETAGFEYLLELRDPEGLLSWQSFQVAVSCADEPCVYRLLPGLEGAPIAVSRDFWQALAEARASGATNLLDRVRQDHPELAGEIPSFAWQWQAAEAAGEGCNCRWIVTERFTPFSFLGSPGGAPPRHESGVNMMNAGFFAGTQSIDGLADLERNETAGTTLLGLELLCTLETGGQLTQYDTAWPSQPVLEIIEPILRPCKPSCTPVIEHETEVRGCAQGGATSRQGLLGASKAEMDASVTLNGASSIAAVALVQIDATNDDWVRKLETLDKVSSARVRGESAVVKISSGATLEARAREQPGAHSYAFAGASMEYRTRLEAQPICDIPGVRVVADHPLRGIRDGGVALERWERP